MTFLHDEITLAKLLAESGLLGEYISKYGQEINVVEFAKKLLNNLSSEIKFGVTYTANKNVPLTLESVSSLDSYINFLASSMAKYNNNMIVLSKNALNSSAFNANLYAPYKNDLVVYKDGLKASILGLYDKAQKENKFALSPISRLIKSAEQELKMEIGLPKAQPTQPVQPAAAPQTQPQAPKQAPGNLLQVSQKMIGEHPTEIQNIKALPFTNRMIDIVRMSSFINSMGSLYGGSEEFQQMMQLYSSSFERLPGAFATLKQQWDSVPSQKLNKDRVAYDLGSYQVDDFFINMFPSSREAANAATILLEMINVTLEMLNVINDEPVMKRFIGEDKVESQIQLGDTYKQRLNRTLQWAQQRVNKTKVK